MARSTKNSYRRRRVTGASCEVSTDDLYTAYLNSAITLATSCFEWTNVPDTMSIWHLEQSLLSNGSTAVGVIDDLGILVNLPYQEQAGNRGLYGVPHAIKLIDADGGRHFNTSSWDIIYDNATRLPLLNTLKLHARKITRIQRIIDANMTAQIRPVIVKGAQKYAQSIEDMFNDIDNFSPFVAVSDKLTGDALEVLPTSSAFIGEQLLNVRDREWAMALASMGISSETTKKERLISDEITVNRQEDTIQLNSRLIQRVELCNKLNKKYGLDIGVNVSDTPASYSPNGAAEIAEANSDSTDDGDTYKEEEDNG